MSNPANYNGLIYYHRSYLIYVCLPVTANLCVSPGLSAFVLPGGVLRMQTRGGHPRPWLQQVVLATIPGDPNAH